MRALGTLRGRHLFAIDLAIVALAIVGAMILRFDSFSFAEEALIYFPAALFPLLVRPPINVLTGLYCVTLPLAGRAIVAGAVIAWARSVSEFGAVVILTYNPKVGSILTYDRFTTEGLAGAVPIAVLLLFVALGVTALARLLAPGRLP